MILQPFDKENTFLRDVGEHPVFLLRPVLCFLCSEKAKSEHINEPDSLPRFTFSYRYARRNQNILDLGRAGRIFDNTFDYTFN